MNRDVAAFNALFLTVLIQSQSLNLWFWRVIQNSKLRSDRTLLRLDLSCISSGLVLYSVLCSYFDLLNFDQTCSELRSDRTLLRPRSILCFWTSVRLFLNFGRTELYFGWTFDELRSDRTLLRLDLSCISNDLVLYSVSEFRSDFFWISVGPNLTSVGLTHVLQRASSVFTEACFVW